jgi:hypothetical protein
VSVLSSWQLYDTYSFALLSRPLFIKRTSACTGSSVLLLLSGSRSFVEKLYILISQIFEYKYYVIK